jgi:biotin synthase
MHVVWPPPVLVFSREGWPVSPALFARRDLPDRLVTMNYQDLADLAITSQSISRDQARAVLASPDEALLDLLAAAWRVRRHFCGNAVHIHVLTNAKSGLCPEDCHYCSQSSVAKGPLEKYPLIDVDKLLAEARRAHAARAKRYCMVLSGRGPSDREIDRICEAVRAIKAEMNLSICVSIGLTRPDQAARLAEAGVNRVNHNLNTSERFYPEVCTTHSWQDRMQTLKTCREAGLELCCGGILGQGEGDEDVIDFFLQLRALAPESIPVNFLIPMAGTPFENRGGDLNPRRCLKILCLARFLNPATEIRVAGGREYHLRSMQAMAMYPANSMFVTGYLTSDGQRVPEAWHMLQDLGMTVEVDGYDDDGKNDGKAGEQAAAEPVEIDSGVRRPLAQIAGQRPVEPGCAKS